MFLFSLILEEITCQFIKAASAQYPFTSRIFLDIIAFFSSFTFNILSYIIAIHLYIFFFNGTDVILITAVLFSLNFFINSFFVYKPANLLNTFLTKVSIFCYIWWGWLQRASGPNCSCISWAQTTYESCWEYILQNTASYIDDHFIAVPLSPFSVWPTSPFLFLLFCSIASFVYWISFLTSNLFIGILPSKGKI